MSDDRRAVEQAIQWAKEAEQFWAGGAPSQYGVLADAAEKWLATLPEPKWTVRVWLHDTGEFSSYLHTTQTDAVQGMRNALWAGARKVEIEKP